MPTIVSRPTDAPFPRSTLLTGEHWLSFLKERRHALGEILSAASEALEALLPCRAAHRDLVAQRGVQPPLGDALVHFVGNVANVFAIANAVSASTVGSQT